MTMTFRDEVAAIQKPCTDEKCMSNVAKCRKCRTDRICAAAERMAERMELIKENHLRQKEGPALFDYILNLQLQGDMQFVKSECQEQIRRECNG